MIKVTNAPVFHHITVYYVISRNRIYDNQPNLVVLVSRSAYLLAKDLFAKLFIYRLLDLSSLEMCSDVLCLG